MNLLIIEDERPALQRIKRLIKELGYGVDIVGELASVSMATNWFAKNPQPDLVFMDIQLEDGISFEIFENAKIECPVIFTTAYEEYALRAFKVNSVDYLLKPINADELKTAIDKYRTIHIKAKQAPNLENLARLMQPQKKERFLIKIGEHYKSIQVKDINCFYIMERGTYINTKANKNYPIDFSLDRLEQLIDNQQFFRVNRNFIINIDSIKEIIGYSSNRLKLVVDCIDGQDDILVSRERVSAFKAWLDR